MNSRAYTVHLIPWCNVLGKLQLFSWSSNFSVMEPKVLLLWKKKSTVFNHEPVQSISHHRSVFQKMLQQINRSRNIFLWHQCWHMVQYSFNLQLKACTLSSLSIETKLWTRRQGNQGLIPSKGRAFSLLHTIQTSLNPCIFLSNKVKQLVHVHLALWLRMHKVPYLIPPYVIMAWHLMKHRDNCIFTAWPSRQII
jgi:hypothetical protein